MFRGLLPLPFFSFFFCFFQFLFILINSEDVKTAACCLISYSQKCEASDIPFNTLDGAKVVSSVQCDAVLLSLSKNCSGELLTGDSDSSGLVASPVSDAPQIEKNWFRITFWSEGNIPAALNALTEFATEAACLHAPLNKVPSCILATFLFWWVLTLRLVSFLRNVLNEPKWPCLGVAMLL